MTAFAPMTGAQLLQALLQLDSADLALPVHLAMDDFGEQTFPLATVDTAGILPSADHHLPEDWLYCCEVADPEITPEAPQAILLWPQIGAALPTVFADRDPMRSDLDALAAHVAGARAPIDPPPSLSTAPQDEHPADAEDRLFAAVQRTRGAFLRALAPAYR